MKDHTEYGNNYAWQNGIVMFTGKTPRSLEVIEDGLKKGLSSLGTNLILEFGRNSPIERSPSVVNLPIIGLHVHPMFSLQNNFRTVSFRLCSSS
jgi:hypothetical protein